MKKYSADKRNQALRLFIESQGTGSLSSIAGKLGVHRKTVAEWKKEDAWEAKLSETCRLAAKKTAEKISDALSEDIAKHFKIDIEHLDILDKILFYQLFEKDDNGNPVRNAQGLLTPNSKLDPLGIQRLAAARHQMTATRRMILGLPTTNQRVEQSIQEKHEGAAQPGTTDGSEENANLALAIREGKAKTLKKVQVHGEDSERVVLTMRGKT